MAENKLSFKDGNYIPFLYDMVKNDGISILFMTELLGVDKTQTGYSITLYGAEGEYTITAKKIIDTTEGQSLQPGLRPKIMKKNLSALIYRENHGEFLGYNENGVIITDFRDGISLLNMELSPEDSYQTARQKIHDFWVENRFDHQTIALISDCFGLALDEKYEKILDQYERLTSACFHSPLEAFCEGVKISGGEIL